MKSQDILRLYLINYPNFELDLLSIKKFQADKKFEKAGERCRDVAKKLLREKLYNHSLEYYHTATEMFLESKNHLKAISTELTVYEIYKLINNVNGMADTYEKIASFYTHYLKNDEAAGEYYFMSAKLHEQNQNYNSAFKKARFSCDCLAGASNKQKLQNAHSLAFRMALLSNYIERAGIHAKKWLELMPKDYSPHYISVCMKGYKSFISTDRTADALFFVNEIIIAHYEKNIVQHNIVKYLKDGLRLYIKEHKHINSAYNNAIIAEIGESLSALIKFFIEMRVFAISIGVSELADYYYFQEMKCKKLLASYTKNYFTWFGYWLWEKTASYGLSLRRWLVMSLAIMTLFGFFFYPYQIHSNPNDTFFQSISTLKPSINLSEHSAWFSPFYYSVVTFATLGYGDITPTDVSGQIFSVLEVLIGYLMLGGLLTIFAKKIIR
jgi:hypothetical protein